MIFYDVRVLFYLIQPTKGNLYVLFLNYQMCLYVFYSKKWKIVLKICFYWLTILENFLLIIKVDNDT